MRVSVSDVDAFRYWRANDLPMENLRARLLRTEPPSPAMAVGRLLHSVLERSGEAELDEVTGGGITLRFELDVEILLPHVREQFISKTYSVAGGEVEMRGRVDAMTRSAVEDHKTTSHFNPEALIDSMQWRYYLDMTGRPRFAWNVFTLREPLVGDPDVWRVVGLDRVEQWAYPQMREDCEAALADFVMVVRRHVPEYGQRRAA